MVDPAKVDIVFKEAFARYAPDFDPLETHFDRFMAAHKAAFAEAVAYIEDTILADWGMIPDPKSPTPRTDAFYRKCYPHSTLPPADATGEGSEPWDHARVMEHELAAATRVISEICRLTSFLDIENNFYIDAGKVRRGRLGAGPALLIAIGNIIKEKS